MGKPTIAEQLVENLDLSSCLLNSNEWRNLTARTVIDEQSKYKVRVVYSERIHFGPDFAYSSTQYLSIISLKIFTGC